MRESEPTPSYDTDEPYDDLPYESWEDDEEWDEDFLNDDDWPVNE